MKYNIIDKKGEFMKKILFVFILLMMYSPLYSQSEVMQFLSMGFNASRSWDGDTNWNGNTTYYFYGYNDYSEAIFNVWDIIALSIDDDGTFYPHGPIRYGWPPYTYYRYTGQNNSVGYYYHAPTSGSVGIEYKFENGRLVYWARGEDLMYGRTPSVTLERVEQNNQSITIYYSIDSIGYENRDFSERYYNISRTELLDIFLKKYVEMICEINNIENNNKNDYNFENNYDAYISLLIRSRTSRELAIFRNCLYAIKGYRFANSTWAEFFNKYLDGYNGQYTNDEVTAMFTENEKWLLDLIIQNENRR
jgi:hypothetical protein